MDIAGLRYRYGGHYACITAGACEDKVLRVLLARIHALDVSVVNPLLMSFFEDYVGDALSHDDFASMLRTTESYLFRRSVCDVATNSLNKFFSSVIARLNAVRDDGGNIREAYEAILLGEEGTARRMPSDAEFERALRTRDCYAFKRGFYLLTTLENSWHAKPLNALASAEWREMLGDDCERVASASTKSSSTRWATSHLRLITLSYPMCPRGEEGALQGQLRQELPGNPKRAVRFVCMGLERHLRSRLTASRA